MSFKLGAAAAPDFRSRSSRAVRRRLTASLGALAWLAASAAGALSIELPPTLDPAAAEAGGTRVRVTGRPDTAYVIQREGLSDVTLGTVRTDAAGVAEYVAPPRALVPWDADHPTTLLAVGFDSPDDWAATTYRVSSDAPTPEATVVSLERLPEQLDNHQRMNLHGVSSAATYADELGRTVQAWAYWSHDRRGKIVTREFPDGAWSAPIDVHDAVTGRELEYDSHNWLSIGVAPDGTLFAAGNMHVDELQMARSTRPFDWTSLVSVPRSALGREDTDRVTYPDFFTLDGHLHLLYREQENAGGRAYFRTIIKRYLHGSGTWETAATLNRGQDLRLYVPKVTVSADGGRAHLVGHWRDDSRTGSGGGSGADGNRDLFHLYSDDGSRWRQYGAGELALPLWYDNGLGDPGTPVTETLWDTSAGDPVPQNGGDVVVDGRGEPHVLLRQRGGGNANFHARRENGAWTIRRLPWSSSSQTLVAHGDRVGALLSTGDRVAYASLDPAHPTWSAPRTIARGLTNSRYHLHQDWTAQSRGHVSLLLTETLEERDGRVGSYDRDAHVLTVPLSLLEAADGPVAGPDGIGR